MSLATESTSEQAEAAAPGLDKTGPQLDQTLSSLFLAAAAVIIGVLDPIYWHYQPEPVRTFVVLLAGIALLAGAYFLRNLALQFAGAAVLLIAITAAVISQPSPLNIPIVTYWPMRIALVVLVAGSWAFLLQPPRWMQRALLACAVPTLVTLALVGGPTFAAQVFGASVSTPRDTKFAPFWITVDKEGALYASDLDGRLVWVFDSSGNPQGTISPALAPAPPTPGPGIIPAGYETELNIPGFGFGTPTVAPVLTNTRGTSLPRSAVPNFDFCGMATDLEGNLYLVDLYDPKGFMLLRFNRQGDITARWPVPPKYQPSSGCLDADADHIYLSSVNKEIFVLDHNGRQVQRVPLDFQPFNISATKLSDSPKDGTTLFAMSPGVIERIDLGSSGVVTNTTPIAQDRPEIPVLVKRNGEVLLANYAQQQIVRQDLKSGKVLGTIGGPGIWPGQFGNIGGVAEDSQGRTYVADYTNRVIERFTPDGKLDAVWWSQAQRDELERESQDQEKDR